MPAIEMVQKVWIKYVAEKQAFGVKCISYYGEEKIVYADDVNFNFVFPARPRPGIAKMDINTNGVTMAVNQPFVIDGDFDTSGGKNTLKLNLHHEK